MKKHAKRFQRFAMFVNIFGCIVPITFLTEWYSEDSAHGCLGKKHTKLIPWLVAIITLTILFASAFIIYFIELKCKFCNTEKYRDNLEHEIAEMVKINDYDNEVLKFFLNEIGLNEYWEIFNNEGFTEVYDLKEVTDNDLIYLGVDKMGHRNKILRKLKLRNNDNFEGAKESKTQNVIVSSQQF